MRNNPDVDHGKPSGPKLPCPFRYITDSAGLAEAAAALDNAPWVAVDTEFVGERHYRARLEVVQLAVPGAIFIIDVQRCPDLAPLRPALEDNSKLKILHAAGQDVALMDRQTGGRMANVFDTQLAAAFLGYGLQVSLTNLTMSLLKIELDGKHTTSDWSERPLTPQQLEYAACDVAWLGAIRDRLSAQLEARGRAAWFVEEQEARLQESVDDEPTPDEELFRRVKNALSLKPRELAHLRELTAWRERTARSANVPRRQVMTDEGLVELATHQPRTREALSKLRRVPTGPAMRYSDQVLPAIERASQIPREQWPAKIKPPSLPSLPTGVVELAQAVLRNCSEGEDVASTLVATTSELNQFIGCKIGGGDLDGHPLLKGWRRELVGERLVRLLEGRLLIRVTKDGLEAVDWPDAEESAP
ncbi:MAG: ribonuclease D [Candidatus Sumerlaeia bacterium]|nr:ribonuclease D [Candidatus Sumerlaeia bacterium]